VYEFRVPKLTQSDAEVEIMELTVNVGDHVNEGDPIAEVETEKAGVVLESEMSGSIEEILVKKGDSVPVGTIVCKIKED
jgi:pyruvate/2-oxoglutarate dehydrogenase complex dihydrolipoamide acyltransferase (E2) component